MTQSQLNLETNDEDIYGRWKLMKKIRAIEYKKMIFTDGEIYTDGNKIIIYLYKSGDVPGNPTGKPVQVAEEVYG